MACFLVPLTEAVVTTAVTKTVVEKREDSAAVESGGRVSWKRKLSWLNNMLWGGSALLALEHVWHGEVVFYPPFLTAMSDPADTAEMLHEMSTVGVGVAILVSVVWLAACVVVDAAPSVRRMVVGGEA